MSDYDSKDFIKKLQRERTDYKYASQVRTIAKSLIQLSVGIYTEPERFVYELLQNAVDAFADTSNDSLEILIKADQEKFVFMHNGKPFNEKDVEGICDVGNGTKANDSKKIGYKGIGFKSVFMPSVNRVSVISGQYCFEFDKQKARSLMPSFPASEGVLGPNDVPWQVIPIDAPQLKELSDPRFNVITIVYTQEANNIGSRINHLFSDLQFLLFLRSNNVNLRFERNGQFVFSVGKKQVVDERDNMPKVTLYKNDQPQSTWMLYTKGVIVPSDVKTTLEHDFNTPDKLKGAESVEISFAVQTNKNVVVRLKDTSVFTFLPTSYRALQQPFLINSNFITDAGRQQLHQESEWNKLIFKKIPELYLDFVSKFSRKYSNYTEVLPTIYPANDTLVGVYRNELQKAFDSIAFVPNRNGNRLLKIGDVLVDKTGISNGFIPIERMLRHLNIKNNSHFTDDSFVENEEIIEYAHNLINLFDSSDLIKLLADSATTSGISVQEDIKLIRFLFDYFQQPQNRNDPYKDSLADTSILYDEEDSLRRPNELFFPSSFREQNAEASDVSILNEIIYDNIKDDSLLVKWLTSLGMRDLSNISFIDYLLAHPDYITTDNALSIGRFLFKVWKQENFLEQSSYSDKIKNLCFLAKDGQLRPICNLYLGSKYRPDDDVEVVNPQTDLYISDEYPQGRTIEDWAFFLKKCGAIYKIGVAEKDYFQNDLSFNFLREAASKFADFDHPKRKCWNYYNPIEHIHFRLCYFTFIDFHNPRQKLDSFILSKVLSSDRNEWGTIDLIYGNVHYWNNRIEKPLNNFVPYEYKSHYHSFIEYIIANEQKFPTTQGKSVFPTEVFINNPLTIELGGKYLPILAIDTKVHESWRAILPFKQNLTIADLLDVLDRVSNDEDEDKDSKKERISKIYREIIERDEQCSSVISEWAKTHKILSHSGEFLPASELTYITVDGFKNGGSKVYCEKVGQGNRDKLLQLLKTLGVQVITQKDITTKFTDPVENDDLKNRLMNKVQYLAILRDTGNLSFDERKAELEGKLQKTHFYKCESIALTYGEDNDTISKSTFSKGDSFYYIGKITPALMEPLLSPLCSLLGLGGSNDSKLMVILITDDHQSLSDYLADCGYDVSKLIEPRPDEIPIDTGTTVGSLEVALPTGEKIVINRGDVDEANQKEINKEARIHAKPYLAAHGYDVSQWEPETSLPDLVGIIKDPNGNPINVVIRSAKQRYIHLSASSFETLMTNPNNLLIVENHQGIRPVTFEELFGNDSNVNLIFDARHTPREYFQALGTIFKYVKNTEFVVRDPHFSTYDEIKGFGQDMKNDGTILKASTDDI